MPTSKYSSNLDTCNHSELRIAEVQSKVLFGGKICECVGSDRLLSVLCSVPTGVGSGPVRAGGNSLRERDDCWRRWSGGEQWDVSAIARGADTKG